MSVRMMSLAWSLELPATDKLVLLALADWSDDNGRCWPSMAQLAKKSGLTDRALRMIIGRLKDAGHLIRQENPGKGVTYTINPGTKFPPEADSARNETTQTPERRSANTSRTIISSEAKASSDRRATDRYHRLPANWVPTKPLPLRTQAKVALWAPGELEEQLAAMHRWALNAENKPGKGRKLDWDAAFVNWLERHDDDRRSRGKSKPANDGLGLNARAAIAAFGHPDDDPWVPGFSGDAGRVPY